MINQKIIPVLTSLKEAEKAHIGIYYILKDIHISQLASSVKFLKDNEKKVIVHLDLIKGLKNDEYAVEYLVHNLGVDGIITIKSSIIEKVKKLKCLSIQRMFLIDTQSYEKSIEIIKKSQPDYIELLPGCIPKLIKRVKSELNIPVIAGGLIDSIEEIKEAIANGAIAISTTNNNLINYLESI